MKKLALLLGLAWLLTPALASAAPGGTISPSYARQLIAKKVSAEHGRYGKGWNVKLWNGTPTRLFQAKVKWGSGPHIQMMVPSPKGTVNVSKGANAPTGLDRVKLFPLK